MVLPAPMRLRGYRCFEYLKREGKKYYSDSMVITIVPEMSHLILSHNHNFWESKIKIAVSISNKVSKKAVIRNKLRRLLHNHIKNIYYKKITANKAIWAFISLKPKSKEAEPAKLLNECEKLLSKASLL